MTVLESPVSMQNQGGASNASNIVNNISSEPIQISPNNFQPQRFVSFDINSYQKLVNIPRPTNSYLTVQPGPIQQLVPIQSAGSGNAQQYVHLQLPNVQQGTNFIQLPVATTQIANIAANTNGLDTLQNSKPTVSLSPSTVTSVQGINPQQFSIQLVQQPISQNQTLTCVGNTVKSVGVPIQISSGLSIRPMLISPVVSVGQATISTTTTTSAVAGNSTIQTAPILQIKNSSRESISNLVNIHPAPITSQLAAKASTTCPSSPKTIKILPSAVSSVSSSLFKALQEVANAPVKSPANTRLPLNNVQTILTNLTPNQAQQLNIQQTNVAPLLPQQNAPKIISDKGQQPAVFIGQQGTNKTDELSSKGFPGTIMMVNPGQPLGSKQQLIIPNSTQSQSMPMFVPITMANNVSVLTNQGSNDRVGQFGPGTTLRIQTQIAPLSSSSTTSSSGTSVTINPSNQKFLIPVRSLDSIAPRISTSATTSTTMSSVTINPGNQKFLIPVQPSSLQQQYVLQTVAQSVFTVSGGGIQVSQQPQKQPQSQIVQQLQQQQQQTQQSLQEQPPQQLQQQQPEQHLPQQLILEQMQQQQQITSSQQTKNSQQQQNTTTKFLHNQQNLARIRQLHQQQQQTKQQQQQVMHQKLLQLQQQKQQQKQHGLNQSSQEMQDQTPVLQCLQKKDSTAPLLTKSSAKSQSSTTSSITDSKPLKKPCNCTKSQCLKLYCECFANGEFCSSCNCRQCLNNISHELERSKAIKTCLERNPYAFHPKIGKGKVKGDNERRHTKGCNCKRSGCLKNYCECYEAKILCSSLCKCSGCKNFEESADRKTLMHLADAAEVRVLQQNAAKTKLASQINIVQKKPTVPGKEKLPFTFMTEDVSKATCDILMAHVQDSEMANSHEVETEESLIEEFSRCLNQIIEKSVNFKKGKKR